MELATNDHYKVEMYMAYFVGPGSGMCYEKWDNILTKGNMLILQI